MKLLAFGPLLLLCSCGYNWGHYNRSLPEGFKTVYVEFFKNISQEVTPEATFTNAMIKEFRRSGFVLVRDKSRAEAILSGTIMDVSSSGSNSATTFQDSVNSDFDSSMFTQFQVNITTVLKLRRALDDKVLWQTTVRGGKTYFAPRITAFGARSSNPLYSQSARIKTIRSIAQEMMNEGFDRLTENF